MKVFKDINLYQKELLELQTANSKKSIGFVPTMGALHEGHLSLVKRAREENDIVVVSIFVNPTQFNDPKDLENYPRTLEKDVELLKPVGCDYILAPQYSDLYPDNYRYKVTENEVSKVLCGAHRPGHFDGVLTVVMKLLNLSKATRAYFGEKDYQQLRLIQDMAKAFFMSVEIIGMPLVRELDGLAMSSRNARLNEVDRKKATELYKILSHSKTSEDAKSQLTQKGFQVDYVEDKWDRRLAAIYLNSVRLIDNVKI